VKKLSTILCVTLIFFSSLDTLAVEKISFTATDFPPYVMVEGEEIFGYNVDVLREVCKRLGVKPEIEVLPWERALQMVKFGKADGIFMPVYTKERAEYMYFTSESSGTEKIAIMAKKGSGITASTLTDLQGMKIGIVRGYSYGKEFDNYKGFIKDISNSNEILLKKLAVGRNQVVASDEAVLKHYARKVGVEVEIILRLFSNPHYIGFTKTLGKISEERAKRFSSALRQVKEDGTFKQIESKYFK
jgi:polar amino acid transport system substrate-binding protein